MYVIRLLTAYSLVLASLAGCAEETPFDVNRGNPIAVAWVETAPPTAAAGATFSLAVRLTGSDQQGVEGWPVVWQSRSLSTVLTAPQGRVSADTAYTDPEGVARITWTLGEDPGMYAIDVRAAFVQRAAAGLREPLSPQAGSDLVVEAVIP